MRFLFPLALLTILSAGCAPGQITGVMGGSTPAGGGEYNLPYNELAPANSRLLEPHLPQGLRHFALSPDRRRIAYSEEGKYPSEIFVATLGGEARKIGTIRPDVGELQWTADGRALLYVEVLDREVPGEFFDWDIPKREVLAHRLMRIPVEGGEPQELLKVEHRLSFQASPLRNEVFFSVLGGANSGFFATIRRFDLETGQQEETFSAKAFEQFLVSPDGARLMVVELDTDQGYAATIKVFDLEKKSATVLGSRPSGAVNWAPNSQGLLSISAETEGEGLLVQRFPVTGEAPETKRFPMTDRAQVGKLQPTMLSPDGRRVVAYSGRSNMIISLETGETRTLDSFGYIRCWLDERTVMGAYRGGQYAVSVSE